jgi:hypothetical protein
MRVVSSVVPHSSDS